MLRIFTTFSGIGSPETALKRLDIDFDIVGISEIDKYAIKSYEAIHGEVDNYGDIQSINPKEIPDMDLFVYSPPCTDISMAGEQRGMARNSGTRSSLLWNCEYIIKEKRPKYLLMENVKALVNSTNKKHFDSWLEILEGYGYTNYWKVLNAKNYGIPQNRERTFAVSICEPKKDYNFPKPKKLEKRFIDMLDDEVENKFYTKEKFVDRLVFHKDLGEILEMEKHEPKLEKIADKLNPNGKFARTHRVYNPYGLCPTLTTMQGGNTEPHTIVNDRIRRVTPKECWRLMGFKDGEFYKAKKVNSDTQLYKQAGNSIVVNVLTEIFRELFNE